MTERVRYQPPLWQRVLRWTWPVTKNLLRPLVLVYAVRGNYPKWMVTPDDPVSPFGSGTTPGASVEKSQVAIYERFGRYVGDVVWLGWRNAFYGLAYGFKPDWLKGSDIRYRDLEVVDERIVPPGGHIDSGGNYVERVNRVGTVWLKQPDGTWLWETTRKYGPIYLITGYRLSGIAAGKREDEFRAENGMPLANRPLFHPNMDGRPIFSIRTQRTM